MMKTPAATVGDLIARSISRAHLLGEGSGHSAFEIADPALREGYVLRVPQRVLLDPATFADAETWEPYFRKQALNHTSHLTPARHVPHGRRYGQALLVADMEHAKPFSIMMRQPGKSLSNWLDAYTQECDAPFDSTRLEFAKARLVKQLLALEPVAFERLLEDRVHLSLAGYPNDASLRNIMFDPDNATRGLSLIDIYDDSLRSIKLGALPDTRYTAQEIGRHIDHAARSFSYHLMCSLHAPHADAPYWQNMFVRDYKHLCARLDAAKMAVHARLDAGEITATEHLVLPDALAVKMQDPPGKLVDHLQRIGRMVDGQATQRE